MSKRLIKHLAYIRLEDVHPLSDPNRLMAAAEELKRRDIPYMIAVIPVYQTREWSKISFEDQEKSSKFLNICKTMEEVSSFMVIPINSEILRQEKVLNFGCGAPDAHLPWTEDEVTQLLEADFENAKKNMKTYVEQIKL